MSLLPIWARVAGSTVDAYVRQALTMFGADGDAATPRSTGITPCDTKGRALMGRKVHNGNVGVAEVGDGAEALPVFDERDEAIVQNVDAADGILRVWLEDKPLVKFVIYPGQSFTWHGADKILVDTAAGTAAWVAVDR